MRNAPKNRILNDQAHSIRREDQERQAFIQSKIILVILFAALLFFLSGATWATATSIVPVAQFHASVSESSLPSGWTLQKYKGTPRFKINQNATPPHLQMISAGETAFGFKKNILVDIRAYPHLNWTWKTEKLPDGGDVRQKDKDDQSIQIYLIFHMPGNWNLFSNPPTLAYIWDNKAPKETLIKSQQLMLSNVRYLVLRNERDKLGRWIAEKRNILEDYYRAFGRQSSDGDPIMVKGVLLFINTHHTKSDAEGCIGAMHFSDQ